MARLDVADAPRAGLDALEEILDVGPVLLRAAALDGRGTLALGDHLKTPAVKVERGVGAVKLHAVAGIAADAVVVAFPHLIELDERAVRAVEFVGHQQGIGRVADVVERELAAGGVDRPGCGDAHCPVDDVLKMHVPVADHAGGVVVEPAKGSVKTSPVERAFGGRAEPAIVIDALGSLLAVAGFAAAVWGLVTEVPGSGQADLAKLPVLHQLDGLLKMLARPLL